MDAGCMERDRDKVGMMRHPRVSVTSALDFWLIDCSTHSRYYRECYIIFMYHLWYSTCTCRSLFFLQLFTSGALYLLVQEETFWALRAALVHELSAWL